MFLHSIAMAQIVDKQPSTCAHENITNCPDFNKIIKANLGGDIRSQIKILAG